MPRKNIFTTVSSLPAAPMGHRTTPRQTRSFSRREFTVSVAGGIAAAALPGSLPAAEEDRDQPFALNYILASPMYGTTPLAEVIAEAPKVGAKYIDIWPRSHANHREQLDELGHEQVAELLKQHDVKLGMITRYDLGPYRLGDEMEPGWPAGRIDRQLPARSDRPGRDRQRQELRR